MNIKTSVLLLAFALLFLGIALFNYSGLLRGRNEKALIGEEELHRVVDAAQVWYFRPATLGGGGQSFDSLDFQRMGLTFALGALEWRGEAGDYRILSRNQGKFVLEIDDFGGRREALDTLEFDSYPKN